MARQGIEYGNDYTCFEADCINSVMSVLNDPTSEWAEFLVDMSGMSVNEMKAILGTLVLDSKYGVYYDPVLDNPKWDILWGSRGEWADLVEAIEMYGMENDLDCGIGVVTLILSGQDTAGF